MNNTGNEQDTFRCVHVNKTWVLSMSFEACASVLMQYECERLYACRLKLGMNQNNAKPHCYSYIHDVFAKLYIK